MCIRDRFTVVPGEAAAVVDWRTRPLPPEAEAEVRHGYAPAAIFGNKARADLLEAFGNLPGNVFARELDSAALVALAVDTARASFLAGDDRGGFLENFEEKRNTAPQEVPIFEEEAPKVRAFLADAEARKAALPIFEGVAEAFSVLVPALVRIVHAAPPVEGGLSAYPDAPMPWAKESGRASALWQFTAFPLLALDVRAFHAEETIRAPLREAKLTETEIEAAVGRIRRSLLETVKAFPFDAPFPSVRWPRLDGGGVDGAAPIFGPDQKLTPVTLWPVLEAAEESFRHPSASPPPTPGRLQRDVGAWAAGILLDAILDRLVPRLVAREAAAAGEARALARPHVSIPSDLAVPVLFNAGAPFRDQAKLFKVIEEEGADGALEGVTFSLRMARDEDSAQLKLLEPDLLGDGLRKRQLHPAAWRSEALSLLPKILGPGPLALYYATWQGVDSDGDFAFHPAPFLELFGMKNDTRARARLEEELRILTRVQLKIERKYGPSMGGVGVRDEARLLEESSFKRTLFFPGRPRLKLSYYRHAPPMLEIQRAYHVKVPREAFRLVGGWRTGAGVKEDGFKAFALVASAYVLARTYATRTDAGKGSRRFHGAAGYEIPLEEILTLSGFTTPPEFKRHPGQVTDLSLIHISEPTRPY